jgi:hypothetical protein
MLVFGVPTPQQIYQEVTIMSAAAALSVETTCPAWCTREADIHSHGLHMGELHEVGDLALSLDQYTGQETAAIGAVYDGDIELNFTLEQAEQLGNILLQLARAGRKAACRAACRAA